MIAINNAFPLNRSHPLNRGLVFWQLAGVQGRTGGNKWYDLVSNRVGTLTSMAPVSDWVTTNRSGGFGALDFDGTNDRVEHTDFLSGGVELTAAAWAKHTDGSSTGKYIFGHMDTGANQRSFCLVGISQKLQVLLATVGTTSAKNYSSTVLINDGLWHQVAFTFNAGILKLFIDGKESTVTKGTDNSCPSLHNSTGKIGIGSIFSSGSGFGYFPGQIDDCRIWTRCLSPGEISEVYRNSRRGYPQLLNRADRFVLTRSPAAAIIDAAGTAAAVLTGQAALVRTQNAAATAAAAMSSHGAFVIPGEPEDPLVTLVSLNTAAQLEHGKSGGIPCKYFTTVSGGLAADLADHEPSFDVEGSGTRWRLTQSGAKKVWQSQFQD